uniref:Galectin n=1 Tax=Monopterus albus TaxID=43700 RepID=A0A3Q3KA53_MONAL
MSDALGDDTTRQAKKIGNTNPSAPACNPPPPTNPGWPGSAPGAPTQPSAPGNFAGGMSGPGAPGQFPFPSGPGAPGQYPGPPSAPGGFPPGSGIPGQYPPAPGAPGHFSSSPSQPIGGTGMYGPSGPGAYPPPAGPGSFPAFPAGGFPPIPPGSWGPPAGGGFPPAPAPGSYGPGPGPTGPYGGPAAPGGMLPYDLPLHAGILPQLLITIVGEPFPGADFHVDFIKGQDVVFHFNPRFNEQTVVRNSNLGGCWGPEERDGGFPFVRGQRFELKILVEEDMFKVAVDGTHLLEYEHRIGGLEDVTLLRVVGDIILYSAAPSMI